MSKVMFCTGSAGFIGAHLVNYILSKGHEVIVLDNRIPDDICNRYVGDVNVVEGDCRDEELVDRLMEKSDVCFHLASLVDVSESMKEPNWYYNNNVGSTSTVVECAKKHRVKVVFTSSASVYGDTKPPIKEDCQKKPISHYANSKVLSEDLLAFYNRVHGTKNVSLRLFNVYGAGKTKGLFHNAITAMLNNKPITINGTGNQTRDLISVDDVVRALWKAGSVKGLEGTYNIGSGVQTSVNKVIDTLQEIINSKSNTHHAPAIVGDIGKSCADVSKAREALSWKATKSLKQGMEELVKWYRTRGG